MCIYFSIINALLSFCNAGESVEDLLLILFQPPGNSGDEEPERVDGPELRCSAASARISNMIEFLDTTG
jgi:hypothetical protein